MRELQHDGLVDQQRGMPSVYYALGCRANIAE